MFMNNAFPVAQPRRTLRIRGISMSVSVTGRADFNRPVRGGRIMQTFRVGLAINPV
jgi:hypothetical protein